MLQLLLSYLLVASSPPVPPPQIKGDALAFYAQPGADLGEWEWQQIDNAIYDLAMEFFEQASAPQDQSCRALSLAGQGRPEVHEYDAWWSGQIGSARIRCMLEWAAAFLT